MIDFIQAIPGPMFLLVYAFVCILTIYLTYSYRDSLDSTNDLPFPGIESFLPEEIAYLRGGVNEVIRITLFRLWNKGAITIEGKQKETKITQNYYEPESNLEQTVYDHIKGNTTRIDIFNSELRDKVEFLIFPIRKSLVDKNLLNRDGDYNKLAAVVIVGHSFTFLLGIIKIFLGLTNDHPTFFLILLFIVLMLIQYFIRPSVPKLTKLGTRFITVIQNSFRWMAEDVKNGVQPPGIDLAFAPAIFGTAILASIFLPFAESFPSQEQAQEDNVGGCGGGG